MASNIEIKARVAGLDRVREVAKELGDGPGRTIRQTDVFFNSIKGRLKLRIFPDGTGELISYERPDTTDAKQSDYQIYQTTNPERLLKTLADALGETATVRKTRELYMVGQTRIHLDDVEELGTFVELEVVMNDDQSASEGREIANRLIEKLGIDPDAFVDCAYADLLGRK